MGMRAIHTALLAGLMITSSVSSDNSTTFCSKGFVFVPEKDGAADGCEPCYPGTFNDKQTHRQTHCEVCKHVDVNDTWLTVLEECTPYSDTQVKCRPYQYWYDQRHLPKCRQCTDCEGQGQYVGIKCSDFRNTLCCPEPGMMVVNEECQKPVKCGVRQYIDLKENYAKCLKCPEDTTNYVTSHMKTKCSQKCHSLRATEQEHVEIRFRQCDLGESEIGPDCDDKDHVICEQEPKTKYLVWIGYSSVAFLVVVAMAFVSVLYLMKPQHQTSSYLEVPLEV